MNIINLIITITTMFTFINSTQATSLLPEPAYTNLPTYCFATNLDNNMDEIEMELVGDNLYSIGFGVTYLVTKVSERIGAKTIQGVVNGRVFAGGGSQSWKLSLAMTMDGLAGQLYVYTSSSDPTIGLTPNYGRNHLRSSTIKTYDIACD